VLLKDGSLFRGTIAELVKDDHVVIVTIVGDTRRFPTDEVQYAGRAEDMPAPTGSAAASKAGKPAPTEPAAPPSVTVRFEGAAKGTTSLHVWTYVPLRTAPRSPFQTDQSICVAPCETTLPAGTYRFGVSGDRGRVEHVPQMFELAGPVSLRGTYEDRRGARTFGWVLLGISAVAGTALAIAGQQNQDHAMQVGGIVGGLAGVGIGLAFGLAGDSAKLVTLSANSSDPE
jgi:hypothetical protein